MYLSRRQLDEAILQSCNSATRLIRNLLTAFFTPSILAESSCFGTRRYAKLNPDIVGACFSKCVYNIYIYTVVSHHIYYDVLRDYTHYLMIFHVGFVMSKHADVGWSSLVDSINDKCANYRRKIKKIS